MLRVGTRSTRSTASNQEAELPYMYQQPEYWKSLFSRFVHEFATPKKAQSTQPRLCFYILQPNLPNNQAFKSN